MVSTNQAVVVTYGNCIIGCVIACSEILRIVYNSGVVALITYVACYNLCKTSVIPGIVYSSGVVALTTYVRV